MERLYIFKLRISYRTILIEPHIFREVFIVSEFSLTGAVAYRGVEE